MQNVTPGLPVVTRSIFTVLPWLPEQASVKSFGEEEVEHLDDGHFAHRRLGGLAVGGGTGHRVDAAPDAQESDSTSIHLVWSCWVASPGMPS